ncbi:MAG: NAD-binding protein [Anaerolineales bacterium]
MPSSFKTFRKRIRIWWSDTCWLVLIVLGLTGLFLGFIGFQKYGAAIQEDHTFLDNLFLTLGLISMETGDVSGPVSWELQVARFLVPGVTAYTAILAFTTLFMEQTDRIRLWFIRDHILICGLGRKGFRLAKQFLKQGKAVVIIEKDESNDWVESIRSSGAIVIQGDATDPELLKKVNLNRAKCVISVLGDDGKNAQVAVQADKLSRDRKVGTLTCIIHIFDAKLWGLLREKELHAHHNSHFRLELFNIFDRGARLMLQDNPPWSISPPSDPIRVLIVGLGKMGQRLIVATARGWRMRNPDPRRKIHITGLDLDAEQKCNSLLTNYPQLPEVCILEALEMDILSPAFDRLGAHFTQDHTCDLNLVYVCLDDESFSLQTGLRLNYQLRKYHIPIVLRMAESGGLSMLLAEDESGQDTFGNLRIFDLLDQTCTAEILQRGTHEILARNLHAAYLEGLEKSATSGQREDTRLTWEQLSPSQKERNRQQADRIPTVLAAAGYRIAPLRDWEADLFQFSEGESGDKDEVALMAPVEHELWRQNFIQEGWRWGPEKDPEKKTHPNLVPWEELPPSEREKNGKFIRDLPRILARAGFQIVKINFTNQ